MEKEIGIRRISKYLADKPEETLLRAGMITHYFLEDLKYAVIKALNDSQIDIVKEMDKVENLYRFNKTMDEVLNGLGNALGMRKIAMDYYDKKEYPTIHFQFALGGFYDGTRYEELQTPPSAIG